MAEDTTVQQDGEGTSAETPVNLDNDAIRQMVEAEAQRIVDARIPGLQSAYEKQLSQVRKELQQAKSEDGYEYQSQETDAVQKELEKAQREAAALRAGRQFPDAFPVYEAMMAADSAEEQMELLQNFVTGKPAAQPEQAPPQAPAAPAAPVDQNNPPTTPAPDAQSREGAERLINSLDVWPDFS